MLYLWIWSGNIFEDTLLLNIGKSQTDDYGSGGGGYSGQGGGYGGGQGGGYG